MEKFGWCFIGTGKLAAQVAAELKLHGGHEIVSVYTRRIERAQAFARRFGGTPYGDAAAAITAEGVQGVYVVTPHNAHAEYVKLAIELGKPVLCEKPFATDAAGAKALFDLAGKKGVYVTEAMWTWFSPVAHQVKHWLDDGEFGKLRKVRVNFHMNLRRSAGRMTDPGRAGGILLDCGVYPLAYLYRLFGKPEKIVCTGLVEKGVDLKEEIELSFPGGISCRTSLSMVDSRGLAVLVIKGEDAKLRLPIFYMAGKAKLKRRNGSDVTIRARGGHANEFDLVAHEIRSGKTESAYVPHSSTLAVLEMMDECRRQLGLVYPFEQQR